LRGTGLQLEQSSTGTYTLVAVPEGVMALPETSVIGVEGDTESAWGPVQGYLATRTAAGTKTDTALAEAPRSISVATRQQMQDRAPYRISMTPCATCPGSLPAATAATAAPSG
jgi:iron complex outermembrane receptor protein